MACSIRPNRLFSLWRWLIRSFFSLLYGPFAWTYDGVAWLVSLGQWNAWARMALGFLHGPMVLELGHGPGHMQVALAGAGWRAVGVDLSPQMGRLARRRLRRSGAPLRLVRARAQALPFRDGSFPEALATFPTEYIVDPRTLAEVRRVLRPSGRLVVVASAVLLGGDPLVRLLEWLYRVTGQREPLPRPDEARFAQSGWGLRAEWLPARRSRVLVVVAEATSDGTSGCASAPPTADRTVRETAVASG
jgi:SAM-dependent methyltransferase